MDWFQRYSIPGFYFIGLFIALAYALYPCAMSSLDYRAVGAMALIIFLPIGYIISAIEQLIYLKWRQLGAHMQVVRRRGYRVNEENRNEWWLEAAYLINAIDVKLPDRYMEEVRPWIARRAAVMAINCALILASFLAIFIIVLHYIFFGDPSQANWKLFYGILLIILTFIILLCWSFLILRRQTTLAIGELYRRVYRFP